MTDYAIGDLQGCLKPFQRALSMVGFDPGKDTLWIAGDLINRGPKSLETLRLIYRLKDCVRIVLGNHDLHLIAMYYGKRKHSEKDTVEDILLAPDAKQLLGFLVEQPLIQHDKSLGFTMTHAGIPSIWSTSKARSLADEVSHVLSIPALRDKYLETMYGNHPDKWKSSYEGTERWRLITNYLTRMRFTNQDGKLDLTHKLGPESPPTDMKPWYEHEPVKPRKTKLLFGHWAALDGLFDHPEVIGLDTGCVWGGNLTIMNLQTGEYFQHKNK